MEDEDNIYDDNYSDNDRSDNGQGYFDPPVESYRFYQGGIDTEGHSSGFEIKSSRNPDEEAYMKQSSLLNGTRVDFTRTHSTSEQQQDRTNSDLSNNTLKPADPLTPTNIANIFRPDDDKSSSSNDSL